MKRIKEHPIVNFVEKEPIGFYFEGKRYFGLEGDTIATALLSVGIRDFRVTEKLKEKRGVFCGIGQCSDCMVTVDGIANIKSCVTQLIADMDIKRQK